MYIKISGRYRPGMKQQESSRGLEWDNKGLNESCNTGPKRKIKEGVADGGTG
jgi:hypothetical protein